MIKLGFFPTPFPSEDFRSILYRYHLYSKNREVVDTNIELFGMKSEFTAFPRRLELLFQKLPAKKNLSIENIIKEYTLLPWFFPFISEKHQSNILYEIKKGGEIDESYVGKLAGNKYGRCIAEDIRYCLSCIKEDMAQLGTGYIHREHQFAFISTCNKHKVKLITHCKECGVALGYSAMEGRCKQGHGIGNNTEPSKDFLQEDILVDLEFLFKNNGQMTLGIVRQKFLEHLFKEGYVSTDGKTRRQLLAQNFLKHYSSDELASVGLSADYIAQRNTLERVFWGDSLVINLPILFLLIRFIAGSLESFINTSAPYATEIPFGLGPWPCANKFCPDYNKMVIQKCSRVDNRYRGVTGKFYCTTCGNEYVRGWNRKKGIKENIRAVITSEAKKDEIVALYLNAGLSMEAIASQLFCSVYSVKQAVKNHLLIGIEEHACAAEQISPKRDISRVKVESIINENPGLSRYEICLKCKTAYEWLKKNDAAWLEKRLPVSKSFDRFDWNEVDEVLSERVSEVARGLIENNPGTRVGIYSIIGALNKTESGRIKNYSQHLPITQKVLQQVAETKEQYQLRHLAALVWQLKNHYGYEEVTLNTILSYRRSYRGISKDMRNTITAKLVEIQSV